MGHYDWINKEISKEDVQLSLSKATSSLHEDKRHVTSLKVEIKRLEASGEYRISDILEREEHKVDLQIQETKDKIVKLEEILRKIECGAKYTQDDLVSL